MDDVHTVNISLYDPGVSYYDNTSTQWCYKFVHVSELHIHGWNDHSDEQLRHTYSYIYM